MSGLSARPPTDLVEALPGLTDWRYLARGGFSDIWAACDNSLGRQVAVKLLRTDVTAVSLDDEALITGTLAHPNIVAVHHFAPTRSGRTCLIMELCSGGSLQDRLRSGPIPASEAAAIVAEVAEALTFAHTKGIFHLDVKPSNILVGTTGPRKIHKLCDFGIALPLGTEHTVPGGLPHTPLYAAPEVVTGGRLGPHTDTWMLAATFGALVNGASPFASADPAGCDDLILAGRPAPLDGDGVTPAMQRAYELALSVGEQRLRTPAQFVAALLDDRAQLTSPTVQRPRSPVLTPPLEPVRLPTRHRRWAAAVGVAATLALAVGGAALALRPSGADDAAPPAGSSPAAEADPVATSELTSATDTNPGTNVDPAVAPGAPGASAPDVEYDAEQGGAPASSPGNGPVSNGGSAPSSTAAPAASGASGGASVNSSQPTPAVPGSTVAVTPPPTPRPTTTAQPTTTRVATTRTAAQTLGPDPFTSPRITTPQGDCAAGWNVGSEKTGTQGFAVLDLKADGSACEVEYRFSSSGSTDQVMAPTDGGAWKLLGIGSALPEDMWWRVCGATCSPFRQDQTRGRGSPNLVDPTRACAVGWNADDRMFGMADINHADAIGCAAQVLVKGVLSLAIAPMDVAGPFYTWHKISPPVALGDTVTWQLCLYRNPNAPTVIPGSCLPLRDDRTTV